MPRRVYFCFHYQDAVERRVQVVIDHWLSKPDHEESGFIDQSTWDVSSMAGPAGIKRLIGERLQNTSVTCVLIGSHTWHRRWVRYEIIESIQRGNRVVAVHLNGIPDRANRTKVRGRNPLELLALAFPHDGASVQILQYANGNWSPAADSSGWQLTKPASESRRGKSIQLSTIYPVYDWAVDQGLENLDLWLGG